MHNISFNSCSLLSLLILRFVKISQAFLLSKWSWDHKCDFLSLKTFRRSKMCQNYYTMHIFPFLCLCVFLCMWVRERLYIWESKHTCVKVYICMCVCVCVCVCKHMCMEVCITLRSVNVLITTKKFQPCNGCNVYVYNVKFVCFFHFTFN